MGLEQATAAAEAARAAPPETAGSLRGWDRRLALLLGCFFLSGASALVYQTAWTREFAFAFGTSELAVATVLAAYMGGLAGGAALGGWLSPRVSRPVLVYGVLELAIGLAALAVPSALRGATALYVWLFAGPETPEVGGLTTALFYAACAFAILLVPTLCMGATLPLLARHAVRDDRELGRRVGLLYAVNAFGAVAGTLLAGFLLIPRLGLGPTVACAVAANGLIFVLAAALARSAPVAAPPAGAATAAALRGSNAVLPMMLASGVASFSYEVLWTRLLGQLLGASVYAFATMLASFLVGIALGAALAARLATDPRRAWVGFGLAQGAAALLSLAALAVLEQLAARATDLAGGGTAGTALGAAIAGATLLPSTLAIGATFPFAVRIAAGGPDDAGPASARVYAWNTVGAIAGALGAGFFALPAFGFAATLAGAAVVNAALAVASAALVRPPRRGLLALAVPLAAGIAALWPGTPWTVLRTTPQSLTQLQGDVRYFAVGRSTTVLLLERQGSFFLTNNGLPEAAILPRGAVPSRDPTLRWLALLPTLVRPGARDLLVVGFGGGAMLELIPPSVARVDVVELEPEVIAANAAVGDLRRVDPLADPRIHVLANDARSALALSGERYDAIVSQPSHPWTAGSSHLYTREFFELARSRLDAGGVFVQWIGPAYVDEDLLRILVATLLDVMPHVQIYQPRQSAGILLVGSEAPLGTPGAGEALAAAVAAGVRRPEDALAALALDEAAARRFAAGAPLNTDHRNHLQIRSPRLRGSALSLETLSLRTDRALDLPPALERAALVRALLGRGFEARARALAAASPDPNERRLALALVTEHTGNPRFALSEYRALQAAGAGGGEARAGIVRTLGGGPAASSDVRALEPAERAVLRGKELAAAGRADALAGEEPALAALPPAHPLFDEATRLRARWRVASGDAARAREALALLDGPLGAAPADLVERARAGRAAGDPEVVLGSAEALLAVGRRATPALARETLVLLEAGEAPSTLRARREDAARRLRARAEGPRAAPGTPTPGA